MPFSPEVLNRLGPILGGFTLTFAAVYLLRPLVRAWARRIEGGVAGAGTGELEELRARVQELEARELRLVELEERLDFTERLLARQDRRALPDEADTPPEALPAAR
ncbi:MAG: hypothetical protein IPK12_17125 [Gemmatimonadetes bacterium]|nr:hypothetical protein [Gemmatimonadota bacterium]